MKKHFATPLPILLILSASLAHADTYEWTSNDGDNWIDGGNWGGASGYPGDDGDNDNDVVNLFHNNNKGSGFYEVDLTSGSNRTFVINKLQATATDSGDNWSLYENGGNATLKVKGAIVVDIEGGGSFELEGDLELGDSELDFAAYTGNTATISGQLIGTGTFDGSDSVILDNSVTELSIQGGKFVFTADTNDSFTGTIKAGDTKVQTTKVNGFRNATINLNSNGNGFLFPNNAVIKELIGSSNLQLQQGGSARNLKVGNGNSGTYSYSGDLSGSGGITKLGSGTWTLTGSNTYTGTTTVESGTLKLNSSGGSTLQVDSGATLQITDTVTTSALSGSGSLKIDGNGGDLTVTGTNSHTGDIQLNGTLSVTSLGSGSSNIAFNDGKIVPDDLITPGYLVATESFSTNRQLQFSHGQSEAAITVNPSKTLTWAGLLTGNGPIIKDGSGILAVTNGSNTFDGQLRIEEGSVSTTATGLENADVKVDVANGLTLTATDTLIRSLKGDGSFAMTNDQTLTVSEGSYSGTISGGTLYKDGNSTFEFPGTHTGTGEAYLTDGVFVLDGSVQTSSLSRMTTSHDTSMEGQGRISGFLTMNGEVSPDEPEVGNIGTIRAQGIILYDRFNCDLNETTADQLIADSDLFIGVDSTLHLSGAISGDIYILMQYDSRGGTFSGIFGLPSGYYIDYDYQGNKVALIKDAVAPQITSISTGISGTTNAESIVFNLIFSEDVDNVDASDFSISYNGVSATPVFDGSGSSYTLTFGSITGDGSLSVALKSGTDIVDQVANPITSAVTSGSVDIDRVAPGVTLTVDTEQPYNSGTIEFSVDFSEPVLGLEVGDFDPFGFGATMELTSDGSGQNYTITLTNVSSSGGSGQLLLLPASGITDVAGNVLPSTAYQSPMVDIDTVAPTATISAETTSPSKADSATFLITFSEGTNAPSIADLAATTPSGTPTIGIDYVSGFTYRVTLSNLTGDGAVTLGFDPGNSIEDDHENPLGAVPASDTFMLDTTAPEITLLGDAAITLAFGEDFTDPGATGSDNFDSTVNVVIGGDTVNVIAPAVYTITYDATDEAGNDAIQKVRTVTVLTRYDSWAVSRGLTLGVNDGSSDDPDKDGRTNFEEFAFDGDPLSGADDGKTRYRFVDDGGTSYFTLTVPIRNGIIFTGSPLSSEVEGITYTVLADDDLVGTDLSVQQRSAGSDSSRLPAPSSGYSYLSFRIQNPSAPRAFMWLEVTEP